MPEVLTIEPDGEAVHAECPDCGSKTRTVCGHPERGAQLMVSIGEWGDGTLPTDRVAFGLECRVDNGPAFMVVDAGALPWGADDFVGTKLTRASALSHALESEVFDILDALVMRDPRFRAFLDGGLPA